MRRRRQGQSPLRGVLGRGRRGRRQRRVCGGNELAEEVGLTIAVETDVEEASGKRIIVIGAFVIVNNIIMIFSSVTAIITFIIGIIISVVADGIH